MAKRILLVNCYQENKEEKIAPYFSFIELAATAAGVPATITVLGDELIHQGATIPGHDAVIVSGSHRMISTGGFFQGFLDFLRNRKRPLLGICYGHQALARAWGGVVETDCRRHDGDEEIVLKAADPLFAGFTDRFHMSESHREVVRNDPEMREIFAVVAVNAEGGIEALHHQGVPLWGVQFHPERSGESGKLLIGNFLKQV